MQTKLLEVIHDEYRTAQALMSLLEAESQWLMLNVEIHDSPYLAEREALLARLMDLGQLRIDLLCTQAMNHQISMGIARLGDLIMRLAELNRENQDIVLARMQQLQETYGKKTLSRATPQAAYGNTGIEKRQALGVG